MRCWPNPMHINFKGINMAVKNADEWFCPSNPSPKFYISISIIYDNRETLKYSRVTTKVFKVLLSTLPIKTK